ncbi:jg27761, partial [Pararge aegeria aegeria]
MYVLKSISKADQEEKPCDFSACAKEYSRQPVEINAANVTATTATFFGTRNTTIIVHGHEGSAFTSLNPTVKDAALVSLDLNVVVVDWSVYASQSYSNAVGAVPSVGKDLAGLINQLVNNSAVTLDTLHLIGFDLGAHVVGFAGRALEHKAARIT